MLPCFVLMPKDAVIVFDHFPGKDIGFTAYQLCLFHAEDAALFQRQRKNRRTVALIALGRTDAVADMPALIQEEAAVRSADCDNADDCFFSGFAHQKNIGTREMRMQPIRQTAIADMQEPQQKRAEML